jgi:hypothetical protein
MTLCVFAVSKKKDVQDIVQKDKKINYENQRRVRVKSDVINFLFSSPFPDAIFEKDVQDVVQRDKKKITKINYGLESSLKLIFSHRRRRHFRKRRSLQDVQKDQKITKITYGLGSSKSEIKHFLRRRRRRHFRERRTRRTRRTRHCARRETRLRKLITG